MFRITNSFAATAKLYLSSNSSNPMQMQRIGAEMTKKYIGAQGWFRFSPMAATLSTRSLVPERPDHRGFQKPSMLFYSTMGVASHSISRGYTKPMLPVMSTRSFSSLSTKYLDPKNDIAFKKIFGEEKHKQIPIDFLNATLGLKGKDKIVNLEFLKTEQLPAISTRKKNFIDVLVQDQMGNQYIVEMQVAPFEEFAKRAQFYAAKTYCAHFNIGEKYKKLKKIIFLAITNYDVFPNKKGYKSDHHLLDTETYERDLKDFSFTFIELPKFQKSIDELETLEDRWFYFLKHATEDVDVEKVIANHPEIKEAYEVLDKHYWTEKELESYEDMMKYEADMQGTLETAEKTGLQKGKAERSIEIATEMLKLDVPIEIIKKSTGLTTEEIQSLPKP